MQLSDLSIRAVSPADGACLTAFFLNNDVPSVTQYFHPFALSSDSAMAIATGSRKDRYYVALVAKDIVGLVMLRGWDDGYEIPSLGILIDRNHHGHGIGGRLLQYAIDAARGIPVSAIRLTVNPDNQIACNFYEKFGFVLINQQTASVADVPTVKNIMMLHLSEIRHRAI